MEYHGIPILCVSFFDSFSLRVFMFFLKMVLYIYIMDDMDELFAQSN